MAEQLDKNKRSELQDYHKNQEKYQLKFSKYLTWLTLLIKRIYLEPRYSRFTDNSVLKILYESNKDVRLRFIEEISCDIRGIIECKKFITNPENLPLLFNTV